MSLPGLDEDDSDDKVPVDTDSSDVLHYVRLPSQSHDHLSQPGRREPSARGILRCSKWTTRIEKRASAQLPIKGPAHRGDSMVVKLEIACETRSLYTYDPTASYIHVHVAYVLACLEYSRPLCMLMPPDQLI